MAPWLANLQQKIDGRVLRERALLFLCALAVVFLLWSLLVQNGIDARNKALSSQLDSLQSQRQALDTQITAIAMATANSPDSDKKNTIATLAAEVAQLDSDLNNLAQGLVSATELPQILQNVLQQTGELALVQLQTLPVRELQLSAAESTSVLGEESSGAGVFKHEVSLRVSGNYFQVVKFLQSLEKSRWRFYWEQLDYTVADYPQADIELRVYTLSAERGLLGV